MTPLSILDDLHNIIVQIIYMCSQIYKSTSHITSPLGIVPSAPITISIPIIFMLHSF